MTGCSNTMHCLLYSMHTAVISKCLVFSLASRLDYVKTVYIVQKHVDKCSEYQFEVEKSLEKCKISPRRDSNLGAQHGRP